MNFYESEKQILLANIDKLKFFTSQTKIKGEYLEALVRDLVRKYIDDKFKVKYGILVDDKGNRSGECDIIVYEQGKKPVFEFREDLVIVNAKDVRFVIQVKSTLTSSTLKNAIKNLKKVKELNKYIRCWIVGFKTKILLKTLYLNSWRSKSVQYLHAFESNLPTENKLLLNKQMELFIETVRQIGDSSKYSWINGLVIYGKGAHQLILQHDSDEHKIKTFLSKINENVQKVWNQGDYIKHLHEHPRN
jgi:hypothetical protein